MAYSITLAERFKKNYSSLAQAEKRQFAKKVELLAQNPTHPSLRTKRIQGSNGLYESSVNMDIRIIWHYADTQIIILLDIGHHDILRQY